MTHPVLDLMRKANDAGHTAFPVESLRELAKNTRTTLVSPQSLYDSGDLYKLVGPHGPTLLTPGAALGDARIAHWLRSGAPSRAVAPLPLTPPSYRAPTPCQLAAIGILSANGGGILRGLPGTGKTWLTAEIIRQLIEAGLRVKVAAPTHKAKSVLALRVDSEVTTVHAMLGLQVGQYPDRDRRSPIDADVVLIEEASMLDSEMLGFICEALRPTTRLILVGDERQLESVGAGSPFKDLISQQYLPVASLKTIVRQSGPLLDMAHAAARGVMLLPTCPEIVCLNTERGKSTVQDLEDLAVATYVKEVQEGCQRPQDVLLLSPYRREDLGASTEAMNKRISNVLFPSRDFRGKYTRGDRVMFTANSREHGFINGEMGELIDWQPSRKRAIIRNDHGTDYTLDEYAMNANVEWGYALTVHKAQGSESKTVILLLRAGAVKMYTRNLLLTALTRVKQRLILVGPTNILRLGLDRQPRRYTGLVALVENPGVCDLILARGAMIPGASLADVPGYD